MTRTPDQTNEKIEKIIRESVLFGCGCGVDPDFQEKPSSPVMDTASRLSDNTMAECVDKIIDLGVDGTPGKREYF